MTGNEAVPAVIFVAFADRALYFIRRNYYYTCKEAAKIKAYI